MNSTAHTGAAGELIVTTYFLSMGLEVFRNVAHTGPVDLFLYNPENGKSLPVDIKSYRSPYFKQDGSLCLSKCSRQREDGVWLITYIHGEASPRLPEGFWELLGME